ncbi:hypothetical protein ACIQ7N_09340 [Lysinibacillus sp. NPDC095746]|uniref:hypothetical protein n=1 Tax=Lysinibacillus sp. NPDC095746 TaxID=3364134 RepID=UPI003830C803
MKSENIHETIEDVQEFGLTQDEIIVSANQEATLDFKENEKMVEIFGQTQRLQPF